jgi:hypothetical protein
MGCTSSSPSAVEQQPSITKKDRQTSSSAGESGKTLLASAPNKGSPAAAVVSEHHRCRRKITMPDYCSDDEEEGELIHYICMFVSFVNAMLNGSA